MENKMKKNAASQTKTKFWLDILIFIAFLIAMDPHSSGISVHEWLSLAMIGAMVAHLLFNWDWIVQVSSRFFSGVGAQNRVNYILNWLFFIDGTMVTLSGVMISEAALPALGIQLPAGFAWRGLHDVSANLGLLLLGIHTALHWNWIVGAFRRRLIQPLAGLFSTRRKEDAAL
jgi:hypothetical protein